MDGMPDAEGPGHHAALPVQESHLLQRICIVRLLRWVQKEVNAHWMAKSFR